ncbi:MAG: ATP-binding cassette domain-containing protein [Spirochaetaceae bacterium]|nr:ATP-binding cassette domain-containing protein [Spirochaetaceae bacterium]MBQ3024524.1 ATP-binding cassette domain-containing protein [Spirochaetaceae bacterium]
MKVENLRKIFKVSKRPKGLLGNISNIFIPKYMDKIAVDDISFEIDKGEAVGFIGSNGAGKSTTIKMLTGILYPSSGNIEVMGFNPQKMRKEYVKKIGVVFGQKSQLNWDLPVIDSFQLLKYIYQIPETIYQENIRIFTELLDMHSFLEQPVRQLSLGQRMKADITAALLHSPSLVFFDEPTIGLDVVTKKKIREFIKYINKEKKITIIFTTHDMRDIVSICDRMLLIDKGNLIYDGKVSEIVTRYGKEKTLIVEFDDEIKIDPIDNVIIHDRENNKKIFTFNTENISTQQVLSLLLSKYSIKDFSIYDMEIEEIIRRIYEGKIKL